MSVHAATSQLLATVLLPNLLVFCAMRSLESSTDYNFERKKNLLWDKKEKKGDSGIKRNNLQFLGVVGCGSLEGLLIIERSLPGDPYQ